jgi:serine/threonine-protein kinase RsbW
MECLEKSFRSRKEFEMHVRMIRHFLATHGCRGSDLLFVGINEAVNNALFHGNKKDPSKQVTLRISQTKEELRISVQDEGYQLDQKMFSLHRSREDADPLLEGGRGFMIMEGCCDRLAFPEPGTICMIVKLHENRLGESEPPGKNRHEEEV